MADEAKVQQIRETLESFREKFGKYAEEVFGEHRHNKLDSLRTQLQLGAPKVSEILDEVLGDASYNLRHTGVIERRDLLTSALMGGNNEAPHNFRDFNPAVVSSLNKAMGTLDAGLWPPKEPPPILVINDDDLRDRCADLLSAPGNYDRVVREATTILEDRLRRRPPHETLTRLIPNSADQTGENLVNSLCSPKNPVLVYSSERPRQAAFHRMLLAVFSHLRNPSHHQLAPATEWSWAWSIVGLIDRLLADIGSCTVTT